MKKNYSIETAGCGIAWRIFTLVVAMCLTALFAASSVQAAVIYVDSDAGGANDGSSWTDAYTDLRDALGAAVGGDEIWVVAGTYKPTAGTDRKISFVLVDGVGLYGGFAGGETARDQRDWETNVAVLSGDIGAVGDKSDNSFHVVKFESLVGSTVLDGFTISGGNANSHPEEVDGGGMYNTGNATVTNCTFSGNSTREDDYGGGGGGIFNTGSATVSQCIFIGNRAYCGGGIWNEGSATVTDCIFSGHYGEMGGGGICNTESVTVTNSTFSGNYGNSGGGIWNEGSATVTNCTFSGNISYYGEGGGMNNGQSATVTNCTFSENSNFGLCNSSAEITVTNCTFNENSYSGIYNFQSRGGGATVINCTFIGKSGAGMWNYTSSATITNCTFSGSLGWGMRNDYSSSATVTNCTFSGNPLGGIDNCRNSSELTIKNTILADNGAVDLNNNGGTVNSSYNIVETYTGFTPDATDITGDQPCLNIGPLADNGGDTWTHALLPGSVAINAGTASGAPATDQRGEPRDASPDIGAYEYDLPVIYVDSGAGGANDGSSWEDAFTDLQDALVAAVSHDEIWVASGTYKPAAGADRTISFVLVDGVGLYGGFVGGETMRDQRDWATYTTTLSGDIGAVGDDGDNSYHVVKCWAVTGRTVLDGFTISGGSADGAEPDDRGGGMLTTADGNLEVANCTFGGNRAYAGGGGMYNTGSPTIANCSFIGNSMEEGSGDGAGMYNTGSPTLTDCAFSGNSMEGSGDGAGMYNTGNPTLTDCSFTGNSAGTNGGGMYNEGSPGLASCAFIDNSAGNGGGMFESGSATMTDSAFNANSADYGGGMYDEDGSPTLSKCTFSDNSAGTGGGLFESGSAAVTDCSFNANSADHGGGMYNDDGIPTVASCTFSDNSAGYGGGMSNNSGSPALTNCTFSGNSADYGGGMDNRDSPAVTNCTFAGNSATVSGAGIYNDGSAVLTIKNTILADNGAQDLYNAATVDSSFCIVETHAGFAPDETDITGDQPDLNLGPLADNGGETWTRALLPGSVAIDAGTSSGAPATDQRGVTRDASPDIGAYERQVIYVDSFAGGANDGSCWTDAYTDLQDALGAASSGDAIWVASGIYKPAADANRTKSFVLPDGIGLYGGFLGIETSLDQRDLDISGTTLSGDIGTNGRRRRQQLPRDQVRDDDRQDGPGRVRDFRRKRRRGRARRPGRRDAYHRRRQPRSGQLHLRRKLRGLRRRDVQRRRRQPCGDQLRLHRKFCRLRRGHGHPGQPRDYQLHVQLKFGCILRRRDAQRRQSLHGQLLVQRKFGGRRRRDVQRGRRRPLNSQLHLRRKQRDRRRRRRIQRRLGRAVHEKHDSRRQRRGRPAQHRDGRILPQHRGNLLRIHP